VATDANAGIASGELYAMEGVYNTLPIATEYKSLARTLIRANRNLPNYAPRRMFVNRTN